MKRFVVLIFTLLVGLAFLADSADARPRDYSYRSAATAGMYKAEYDRLYDNPAYVGAKIKYPEYQSSITKEKNQLYTTIDNLNTDGRFLLGGIGDPGLGFIGGIGGYVELGMQTTPQYVGNTYTEGLTSVTIDGDGAEEGSSVYVEDNTGDDIYDVRETLKANEESYWTDNHINALVAVGGIDLGGFVIGASLERNTDDMVFGDNTGELSHKGGYSYTNERLSDGHITDREKGSFDNKITAEPQNYLLTIGGMMDSKGMAGGLIDTIEAMLAVNYLHYESKEDNSGKVTDTDPGNETLTYSYPWTTGASGEANLKSDEIAGDAWQLGVKLQARQEIGTWASTIYLMWMMGGLSPNQDRKMVYLYSEAETYPNLAEYENSRKQTGTEKYSGDGLTENNFQVGWLLRKKKENLLMGIGIIYSLSSTEDKYTVKSRYSDVERNNDGDGVVDAADFTLTRTGAVTDKHTDSELEHSASIPMGLEYQATPTLCWRIGAVHTTSVRYVENKRKRTDASAVYYDEDYENIPGDETTNDGIDNASTTTDYTVGSYNFNTEDRSDRNYRKYSTQSNTYYFGLGYTIEDPLQIDVLMTSGSNGSFVIQDMSWDISVTYIF